MTDSEIDALSDLKAYQLYSDIFDLEFLDDTGSVYKKVIKKIIHLEEIEQWAEGAAAFFAGDKTWPISSYIQTAKNLGLIK